MQTFIKAAFLPIAAILATSPLSAEPVAKVHVPPQTQIQVQLKDAISSSQAYVGQRVSLIVLHDVAAGGYVVFSQGSDGSATVDKVSSGVVHVTFNWVHAVDGSKIGVAGEQTKNEAGSGSSGGGLDMGSLQDGISRAGTVANSAGVPDQMTGGLGRVQGVVGGLFGGRKAAPAATPAPVVPIVLVVKNPNGVTVSATKKSDDDDSNVK